jgi:uncharacterized iron-regulated protein
MAPRIFLLLCFFLLSTASKSQGKSAYELFNDHGKKTSFKKLLRACLHTDVVFFGEFHDNPIAHWLQLELLTELAASKPNQVKLGFEMLERDQQSLLQTYLDGGIDFKQLTDTTKLWVNFETDYLPLVEFAKVHRLPVLATNVPRRYASSLFKKGWSFSDSLSENEKSWMCSLPFEIDTSLSQYRLIREMSEHMKGLYMLEAQALKDATMAESISRSLTPNSIFLHINGAFHSDFYQGIAWYLRTSNPSLRMVFISTVSQSRTDKLDDEHIGRADFIICVPENMTKTH